MKAQIRQHVRLTNIAEDKTGIYLQARISLPALPRVGDLMQVGFLFIAGSMWSEAYSVDWKLAEDNWQVLEPVISLKDKDFSEDYRGYTFKEAREKFLKELDEEVRKNKKQVQYTETAPC